MQVASTPYSSSLPHSHYHSYYHLHPPGPQDHDLKRRYLALLPPHQIIEICLTFDLHVPPYVKSTIWPPDINAAIAGLQKATPQPSTEQPAEEPSKPKENEPAVMDSLKSPAPQESTPSIQASVQDGAPPTEPQPPDKETPAPTSDPSTSPDQPPKEKESPAPSTPQNTSTPPSTAPEPAQPAPTAPPLPPPPPPPQPQYPHQPYSYAHHPQATYPISPYYAQPPGGYSYPYAPYANPMQSAYHPQPPAAYPAQPSIYNNMLSLQHPAQQQQDGMAGDDLPSYEEMIVEALTGCVDPEGWAPKDLFSWMASRYPLQSNFRPSASQALQKAYKRGRFGKSASGKYSLNPAWEGGNTTRRTTRRPQTQSSQSTPSAAAPQPPFTHAPLVHHHHAHPSTSTQPTNQPYPPQPFGYPPYSHGNYPGYPPQPNPSTSTAARPVPGGTSSTSVDKASAPASTSATNVEGDSADAYEAAQNILSAINFNNMYQIPPEDTKDGQGQPDAAEPLSDNGVEQLLSHVKAMLASNAAPQPVPPSIPQPTNVDPAEDPRAELQAQFALLAAQLAELAQVDETASAIGENNIQPAPPPPSIHVHPPSVLPSAPPPTAAPTEHLQAQPPIQAPIPITALPQVPVPDTTHDDIPEPMPEGEDSDDDDMEEII